jgi:peroxiredoxin
MTSLPFAHRSPGGVSIMKTKAIIIAGVTIALAIFIYGAARRSPVRSSPASIGAMDKSAIRAAPEFELKTLDGRAVKLSDFRGKPVVVNFWATYCGPCRVEMPWLIDLYKQYRSQGLEIVGVSMDDDGEQQRVADFVREIGANYTILLGNHTVGDAYGGARFLPQTFFINRDGQITGSATGMKSKSELAGLIQKLVSNDQK